MPRRILFVTDSLFPAGNALPLKTLADGLSADGHDVHVATTEDDPFAGRADIRAAVHAVVPHSLRALNEVQSALGLRKLIKQIEPDFVHSWCGRSNHISGLALTMLRHRSSVPGFFSTELYQQPQVPLMAGLARRRINRRPERLVVPHETLKQSLIKQGVREHRVSVIPNGIQPARTSDSGWKSAARKKLRDDLGLPDDAFVAVTAAPLTPRCRIKDLIWAIDLLVVIRKDIHLLIIGAGRQEWQLRHYVGFTESEKHIHFAGNHPDSLPYITGADFYWHSHLLNPLPAPMMLAMRSEVPVVSVFGPGTSELIISQQTGLAANFGARDEFARWTKYLIEQPHSAEQLARQGREHLERNFDAAKMITAYRDLYEAA